MKKLFQRIAPGWPVFVGWLSRNRVKFSLLALVSGVMFFVAAWFDFWMAVLGGVIGGLLTFVLERTWKRTWTILLLAALSADAYPVPPASVPRYPKGDPVRELGSSVRFNGSADAAGTFVPNWSNDLSAGPLACGVAVLVIGGTVVYCLTRCLKKLYAPKTNSAPEEFRLSGASGSGAAGSSGASDLWFCEYCAEEPDVAAATASGLPVTETVARVTVTRSGAYPEVVPETETLTRSGFRSAMAGWGFTLPFGRQWVRDGVPVQQWDTGIVFADGGTVPHITITEGGGPLRTSVVERTFDWKTFTPLFTNTSGLPFEVIDTTAGEAAFYRITRL